MKYSKEEVLQYMREEDVKFIRLAFCDVFGRQKNISIMPQELPRAFEYGIAIDASAITGFGDESHSDLFLHPDTDTLTALPWRPEHGRVVRMFCSITGLDGKIFECDTRSLLRRAVQDADRAGYQFFFGAEQEFYLFRLDDNGTPTKIPHDHAAYMDIAPEDKGEDIRREVCLMLDQMGILPESSHHEEGPGQNEIDFRYSDPLTAADNSMTFQTVVKTIAGLNGIFADFSPKPLENKAGNGFNFFHFMIDLEGGPCVYKRLSGCGSGTEYLAVTPWGDLYPCHQFVGNEDFLMGNVWDGIKATDIQDEFKCCNVYAKEKCRNCFARFYCSGGCAANSYNFHGTITDAYDLGCELQKKRIECAIMIKAAEADMADDAQ